MMDDRELLEMAAKAAGIVVHAPGQKRRDDAGYGHVGLWTEDTTCWNPLTNDGDAFRLACDLGLRVYPIARTLTGAACSAVASVSVERLSEVADASLDTQAATRRAIVRAAAEIARAGAQKG